MATTTTTTVKDCHLDKDCLITIFEHLSMAEKLKCRLVCGQWRSAVDRLIAGQQYLEVYAVNSSLATAAIEATGVSPYYHPNNGGGIDAGGGPFGLLGRLVTGGHLNIGNPLSAVLPSSASLAGTLRGLQNFWSSVNAKWMPAAELPEDGGEVPPVEAQVAAPENPLQNAFNQHILVPQSMLSLSANAVSTSELDLLQSVSCSASSLVHLSSYYWTYAFCASSSLFSSYSFAQSTVLTSHEYHHSFCDCYPRQRHKYSVVIDRRSLSFETLNVLLTKFRNVHSLVVRNVDQLSDVLLFTITQRCRNVQSLSFTNCSGLKREKGNHHAPLNCLTDYGWRLLATAYPYLSSLTLRQCKLTEEQLTAVVTHCTALSFLDISDNEAVGRAVRHLGPRIECLIAGDLSNEEPLDVILGHLAAGNGRHLKYLSLFGALGSLRSLAEFSQLAKLELHFYTDEELPNYLADIGALSLSSLVLEQIRCYECPSAVNAAQFEAMLARSGGLRRLQITGDFDWNLRLTDESLRRLTVLCPRLQELTLNGNGALTDYGILHLTAVPLVQLSLSSFHSITDYSIKTALKRMTTLRQVTLVDMPQVTDRVVSKAIAIAATDDARRLSLTLSDEQMSRRIRRRHLRYPPNLTVNFDAHLCGKQLADTEPTDVQMILVIIMSAIILGMTLLTTVVVILVPLSMLLMMTHEWAAELIFPADADAGAMVGAAGAAAGTIAGETPAGECLFDWLLSAVMAAGPSARGLATSAVQDVIGWWWGWSDSKQQHGLTTSLPTSVDDSAAAAAASTTLLTSAGSFLRKLLVGVLVSSK